MAKKKLSEEQLKEIKLLQANNQMLEKTKEEAKLRGTQNAVKRIELAQEDVISQIAKIDEEVAKETAKGKDTIKEETKIQTPFMQETHDVPVHEAINNARKEVKHTTIVDENAVEVVKKREAKMNTNSFNTIPNDVQYDVISLPSNGECYPSKVGRLPVGYLTAYDENFLTSPNLYQDGLVIDFLVKNKILDKEFDVDNMCNGDVDAIVLFLRATSYGADFPISVRDPQTKERFDTVVDLTQFKNKEFKLKGDENGYFSYTLPISKDEVKFKYLTRREEKDLSLLSEIESRNGKSLALKNIVKRLNTMLADDVVLEKLELMDINKSIDSISNWSEKVEKSDDNYISKLITNRMEMNIQSVNGNDDREYISEYVKKMPVRDSFMLRRYITENEPGIDWSFTVQRPESLGGGSFETFLNWDDTVFFNISEG